MATSIDLLAQKRYRFGEPSDNVALLSELMASPRYRFCIGGH